jgi:hypothetical protein
LRLDVAEISLILKRRTFYRVTSSDAYARQQKKPALHFKIAAIERLLSLPIFLRAVAKLMSARGVSLPIGVGFDRCEVARAASDHLEPNRSKQVRKEKTG